MLGPIEVDGKSALADNEQDESRRQPKQIVEGSDNETFRKIQVGQPVADRIVGRLLPD